MTQGRHRGARRQLLQLEQVVIQTAPARLADGQRGRWVALDRGHGEREQDRGGAEGARARAVHQRRAVVVCPITLKGD